MNYIMTDLLLTGFTPFDRRTVNASWIAARLLEDRAQTLEIPVVWGKPLEILAPLCETDCPRTIIAMGEGREGWFDIETRARNVRDDRPDNEGTRPSGEPILAAGPPHIEASIDARRLQSALLAGGFPVRISADAGAFLCEEMLYSLELLRERHDRLETVAFIHLPPFGTRLHASGRPRYCDEALLADFTRVLLDAVAGASNPAENVHNA
ncbi:MAG: hypothetical protein U5O39_14370 [Gammaproteobacteria bacterium]|nr:hypothetical protein [Gammaproteobacteria bacterium]